MPTLYENNLFYIQFKEVREANENYFNNNATKVKNVFYNLKFLEKFHKRFVPLIPLWTSILDQPNEPTPMTENQSEHPISLLAENEPHTDPARMAEHRSEPPVSLPADNEPHSARMAESALMDEPASYPINVVNDSHNQAIESYFGLFQKNIAIQAAQVGNPSIKIGGQ